MFTAIKRHLTKNHRNASERQLGLAAMKYYAYGGVASVVWVGLFASGSIMENFAIVRGSVDSDYQAQYVAEQAARPIKATTAPKHQPKTPQEAATIKYPMPVAILNGKAIDKPDFQQVVTRSKNLVAQVDAWEQKTGLRFRDQPIFWDVGDIEKVSQLDPDLVRVRVENLNKSILDAYFNAADRSGKETGCSFERTRAAQEACLSKLLPVVKVTGSKHCSDGQRRVYCGFSFREYMTGTLAATNDYELYYADYEVDYFNRYNRVKDANLAKVAEVEKLRADYIAQITPQYEQGRALAAVSPIPKAQAAALTGSNELVNAIPQNRQVEAWRFVLLFLGFSCVAVYVLAGNKYAIFRQPSYVPNHYYLGAFAFFGIYAVTFWSYDGEIQEQALKTALLCFPPLLFMTVPIYRRVVWEWIKEHREYREIGILGKKSAAGRWGGVQAFFKQDNTRFVNAIKAEHAPITNTSPLYLGKTNYKDDFQMIGRHIATESDSHHILCSTTGGGKSLYGLNNIIAAWNGGILNFDIKGEMYEAVTKHKTVPKYVFDPYGGVKDVTSHQWNPLAEIDPTEGTARARLQRLCEAIVFEKGTGGGSSEFFKENGQMILRGFCAHALTAFAPEHRNLPAVYDLFKTGYFQGEQCPQKPVVDRSTGECVTQPDGTPVMADMTPQECQDAILQEMLKNEAIGASPRDAAQLLLGKDPKLKENFFSTVSRAIDWCNDDMIRPYISGRHDFSMAEIKTRDAIVTLCIPEDFIQQQTRFMKVFYQTALDLVDNYHTPNDKSHKRKMLFIFEEFNLFGTFAAAENLATFKRGSGVKGLFVVQSLRQIYTNYKNPQNFLGNCDIQAFGVAPLDTESLEILSKALGERDITRKDAVGNISHVQKTPVLTPHELKEYIDIQGKRMLFLPVGGHPLMLDRVACYKNFPWTKNA